MYVESCKGVIDIMARMTALLCFPTGLNTPFDELCRFLSHNFVHRTLTFALCTYM